MAELVIGGSVINGANMPCQLVTVIYETSYKALKKIVRHVFKVKLTFSKPKYYKCKRFPYCVLLMGVRNCRLRAVGGDTGHWPLTKVRGRRQTLSGQLSLGSRKTTRQFGDFLFNSWVNQKECLPGWTIVAKVCQAIRSGNTYICLETVTNFTNCKLTFVTFEKEESSEHGMTCTKSGFNPTMKELIEKEEH